MQYSRCVNSLNASGSNVTVIPNFSEMNEPMQHLKQRSASAKPLGLVKVASNELLVIFDGTSSAHVARNSGADPCT